MSSTPGRRREYFFFTSSARKSMVPLTHLQLFHNGQPLSGVLGFRLNRFSDNLVTVEFADREPLETEVLRLSVSLEVPQVPWDASLMSDKLGVPHEISPAV